MPFFQNCFLAKICFQLIFVLKTEVTLLILITYVRPGVSKRINTLSLYINRIKKISNFEYIFTMHPFIFTGKFLNNVEGFQFNVDPSQVRPLHVFYDQTNVLSAFSSSGAKADISSHRKGLKFNPRIQKIRKQYFSYFSCMFLNSNNLFSNLNNCFSAGFILQG